jgi:hypothetical protein
MFLYGNCIENPSSLNSYLGHSETGLSTKDTEGVVEVVERTLELTASTGVVDTTVLEDVAEGWSNGFDMHPPPATTSAPINAGNIRVIYLFLIAIKFLPLRSVSSISNHLNQKHRRVHVSV